jgi:glutathione S-transferase
MKLYFSPGTCSLSPHIALREAGLDFELVRVDIRQRKLADGSDFTAINRKGYVPVLELDNGLRLTEGPAIVQYIADRKPASGLAPRPDTIERYQLQEWLGFINSELHKGFSPLFRPDTPDDYKQVVRENLAGRLGYIADHLASKELPDGRPVHRRRRLPVHGPRLGPLGRHRHRPLAVAARLPATRRRAPERARRTGCRSVT